MCFVFYDLYCYLMKVYTSEEHRYRSQSCPPCLEDGLQDPYLTSDSSSYDEEWVKVE
jgi:hypothetical protein